MNQSPSIRTFIPTALLFALSGWGGLAWVLLNMLPTVGGRWLFFFLWFLALTGSALPVIAFLHRRFPGDPPPSTAVITRQAVWVGFYAATLAWLQMGRVVTLALALLIAVGFMLIEWFIRLREKSLWEP